MISFVRYNTEEFTNQKYSKPTLLYYQEIKMSDIPDKLIEMRANNIGRLFQRAARTYSERALALLHERGFTDITLYHTVLIAILDINGDQITSIADKAGISKQAMGQIANDLCSKGYIQKTKSQTDKRAFLVEFTEHGKSALKAAFDVKLIIEDEYKILLGVEDTAQLRLLLERLISGTNDS